MDRTGTEAHETYLVEHYRPGLTAAELGELAIRVRDAATQLGREGKGVRYLRSAVVPVDEALLCVFEATSERFVREAYARAGLPFERISAVIPDGQAAATQQATSEEER